MTNRRSFLAGVLAAGLCPRPTWADVGSPAFLSAALRSDGTHVMCGLGADGQVLFQIPLPDRGHAAAAHPKLAEAVAFARRPGRFALIIDCETGQQTARLEAPVGRHFYGHGTFSDDGQLLFTTENDFEAAQGIVGVWDAGHGYARIGEFRSGGVGPHDIKLMPDGETLVVANGGIETHPETGRTKLNLPSMRPNLSFLNLDGTTRSLVELDKSLHKNSIRHLAVAPDGAVAFAMQWQGDTAVHPPLLGIHRLETGTDLMEANRDVLAEMRGYAGSVAISPTGREIAVTSPKGGVCQVFDTVSRALDRQSHHDDVCGVASSVDGFILTAGTGLIASENTDWSRSYQLKWDNHLVPIV